MFALTSAYPLYLFCISDFFCYRQFYITFLITCYSPQIFQTAIHAASAAGTGLKIMHRFRFNHLPTHLTLNTVFQYFLHLDFPYIPSFSPHSFRCNRTMDSTCVSLSKLKLIFSSMIGSLNLMDFSHCPLGWRSG